MYTASKTYFGSSAYFNLMNFFSNIVPQGRCMVLVSSINSSAVIAREFS